VPARRPGTLRASRALVCIARIALSAAVTSAAGAQAEAFKIPVQFEARVDALGGPPAGVQLGVGANVAAGYYVRIGADIAAGAASRDGAALFRGRADLTSRFLLDPFHQFAWGPYVGGGLTAQWDRRANWRGDLLVLIGFEGPARAGWRTSVELGLGGGARLGVVFRRARSNSR
jgi:hypothetical protein